ncbi:MAG: hypothetical protein NC131_00490 [Roseburia sp.]|nr:hypothetical protein [Roseburia sp.]
MSKSAVKNIIMAVAVVLAVGLLVGFIVYFAMFNKSGDKTNYDGQTETNSVQTVGKVYDGDGKELETGKTYELPKNMAFSARVSEPLASQLKLAPMSVNVTVTHSLPLNNIKVDWAAKYTDGTDASRVVGVTPSYDGSATATIECLKPFSKQVIVTATLRNDNSATASCKVDYVKRLDGVSQFCMTGSDFMDSAGVDFYATFTDGTIMPDVYLDSVWFHLNDSFTEAVKSYLKFDIEFTDYAMRNIKGELFDGNGKIGYSCEPGGGYDYAWFIKGFNDMDDAHKQAVYYAWYHGWLDQSGNDRYLTMTVDYSVTGKYKGNSFGNITETEYVGVGYLYLSGEQYGDEITPSLTLNNNIAF